ncbi:hypothetical protein GCM10010211_80010 [Streptomyces albospinus]|uniref:Secreted protein n=1 Tax=Streptomyces albospinus TaxID=285515 RepID=A0ABQ2VRI8_9ACTN|nr:hypothetical protein [Streptomyces albospinus]GGV00702.1 hypothetical protein GCM10010211_80010 [Streptomyces albospinus]
MRIRTAVAAAAVAAIAVLGAASAASADGPDDVSGSAGMGSDMPVGTGDAAGNSLSGLNQGPRSGNG